MSSSPSPPRVLIAACPLTISSAVTAALSAHACGCVVDLLLPPIVEHNNNKSKQYTQKIPSKSISIATSNSKAADEAILQRFYAHLGVKLPSVFSLVERRVGTSSSVAAQTQTQTQAQAQEEEEEEIQRELLNIVSQIPSSELRVMRAIPQHILRTTGSARVCGLHVATYSPEAAAAAAASWTPLKKKTETTTAATSSSTSTSTSTSAAAAISTANHFADVVMIPALHHSQCSQGTAGGGGGGGEPLKQAQHAHLAGQAAQLLLWNGATDVQTRQGQCANGPLPGFYVLPLSAWKDDIKSSLAAAIRAGEHASHVEPINLTPDGVLHHVDWVDHKGTSHFSALGGQQRWNSFTLLNRMRLTPSTVLLRFRLPSKLHQVGLYCGQYVAIRAKLGDSDKYTVRYYSPVSRNSSYGIVDLLVKVGVAGSKQAPHPNSMAAHLTRMNVGDPLEFRGPMGGFIYHRNMYKAVGMIAGGSGITPMVQLLRSVFNHPEDATQMSLLYGCETERDILCKDELLAMSATRSNLDVQLSLVEPPPRWTHAKGFISKELIRRYLPKPGPGVVILLCGPPVMIKAMVKMLKSLGYSDSMIYDFLKPPKPSKIRRGQGVSFVEPRSKL